MKLAKNFTILSGLTGLSLCGATYVNFPELRDHKYELFRAMKRLSSVIITSVKMGCIYKFNVQNLLKNRMIYQHLNSMTGQAKCCWML